MVAMHDACSWVVCKGAPKDAEGSQTRGGGKDRCRLLVGEPPLRFWLSSFHSRLEETEKTYVTSSFCEYAW